MIIDPPKDEGLDRLLQEVHNTLQENQRFLADLKQDRIDDYNGDVVELAESGESFEEL